MWWILAGVAVAAIFDSASNKEKEAAQRWESKRRELKQSISIQRKQISHHIRTASFDQEFHRLNNLYYESRQTANLAYQTYNDAKISLKGVWKMLKRLKGKRKELRTQLKAIKERNVRVKDKSKKISTIEVEKELSIYKTAIEKMYMEMGILQEQKNEFQEELKSLNQRTHWLKENIRDRCGHGGMVWYNRLENKKSSRRYLL